MPQSIILRILTDIFWPWISATTNCCYREYMKTSMYERAIDRGGEGEALRVFLEDVDLSAEITIKAVRENFLRIIFMPWSFKTPFGLMNYLD